ncbi:hypothetical protein P691DRAFT_805029, partial [Macrolepiota fuliginosa MF-IS2]
RDSNTARRLNAGNNTKPRIRWKLLVLSGFAGGVVTTVVGAYAFYHLSGLRSLVGTASRALTEGQILGEKFKGTARDVQEKTASRVTQVLTEGQILGGKFKGTAWDVQEKGQNVVSDLSRWLKSHWPK